MSLALLKTQHTERNGRWVYKVKLQQTPLQPEKNGYPHMSLASPGWT